MPTFSAITAYLRDLAERVGSTFVETFAAVLAASWTGAIPSDWRGWLTAAFFGAAAATLKGLAAKGAGDSATASLLPSLMTRKRVG
jgi:hypothetical protein